MTVTYQRETDFDKALADVKEVAAAHWQEFSYFPGIADMDINYGMYARLNEAGSLRVITARRDGKLIGYHLFSVGRHQHRNPDVLFGQDIVLYVAPGPLRVLVLVSLVRYSEQEMRALGVKVLLMRSKRDRDIGPMLTRMGMKPLEVIYGKVLT